MACRVSADQSAWCFYSEELVANTGNTVVSLHNFLTVQIDTHSQCAEPNRPNLVTLGMYTSGLEENKIIP